VFEKDTPDFKTQMWIGKQFCGEQRSKGYSTETTDLKVPMPYVFNETEATNDGKRTVS
jgi:hypothetical protein